MAFRANPHYNDPAFAQAASNIASLFAPPSGSDAAGWAAARAKGEEAARVQWLFDNYGDPSASSRSALTGVQNYGATPEGFRYNVDQGNLTQRYGYDTQATTSRANNAADNARAVETNRLDNQTRAIGTLFQPLNPGQIRPEVGAEFMDLLDMPVAPEVVGPPKPKTEDELKAAIFSTLPVDEQKAIVFGNTPVENVVTPEGPRVATRRDAVGKQPYEAASAERVDNYLAVGPNGEEVRFLGSIGPNGKIININTGQVVPNVLRKEGTGGGVSFEADGQGGVRFTTGGAGNTVSQQTNLQGQRDAATQSARELQTLFDNITASDVGVAGNFNDFLTNYGAQVFPDVARGDVTAMRTQMQAATMRLARSLAGDNRIDGNDRRMAQEIMAGQGLGESLPGARAKIAALTVLHAYRAKFAGSLAAGGDPLPPINGAVLGQLVDDGAISPALAAEYQRTMLSGSRGGPTRMPGAEIAPGQSPATTPQSAPAGVDPADWEFMTPEQKALFR